MGNQRIKGWWLRRGERQLVSSKQYNQVYSALLCVSPQSDWLAGAEDRERDGQTGQIDRSNRQTREHDYPLPQRLSHEMKLQKLMKIPLRVNLVLRNQSGDHSMHSDFTVCKMWCNWEKKNHELYTEVDNFNISVNNLSETTKPKIKQRLWV